MAIQGNQSNLPQWDEDEYIVEIMEFFAQELGESTVMFDKRRSTMDLILDRSPGSDASVADVFARVYANVTIMGVGYPPALLKETRRATGKRVVHLAKRKSSWRDPAAVIIKKIVAAIKNVYDMPTNEAVALAKAHVKIEQGQELDDEFMDYYNDVMNSVTIPYM